MTHGKDWFDSNDPHPRSSDNVPSMPAPIPSITDLGRCAAAAGKLSERYDSVNDPTLPITDGRNTLCLDRERAFLSLLATFPAKTLSDAAVQLFAAFCTADELTCFEGLSAEGLSNRVTRLRRICLSTLPIVAAAAGLDLEQIGAGYIPGFRDREFPAEA